MLLFYFVIFLTSHFVFGDRFDDLLPKDCGVSNLNNRIIGGEYVNLGQFPWMALIYVKMVINLEKSVILPNCGGALITDRFVLTAAHCVDMKKSSKTLHDVSLGDLDITSEVDCQGDICAPPAQRIMIEAGYYHEMYGMTSHDIGLLKLAQKAILNDFLTPICLPKVDLLTKNDLYQVTGWGVTEYNATGVSSKLKTVTVKRVSLRVCRKTWPNVHPIDQICAGGVVGQDSCQGDSGGPLTTVKDIDGGPRYYLMGVVSYGKECGGPYPAVYTNVHSYIDWILDKMEA